MILPFRRNFSQEAVIGPDAEQACSVSESAPVTFPALTGVRILAAYLVFWHHYPLPKDYVGSFVSSIFAEGHIGVTVFFVLSGFLITYRYRDGFRAHKVTLFNYSWNRIARIYPVYFAVAIATLVVHRETGLWNWFLQLTLTKGLFDQYKFTGVAQAWSLTVEECFYFSAPLLFLAFRHRRGILFALLSIYALGAICLLVGSLCPWHGLFGSFQFVVLYTFLGRSFEFLIGAKLAIDVLNNPRRTRTRPFRTYLGMLGVFAALVELSKLRSQCYSLGALHPAGMLINNFLLPLAIVAFFRGLLEEDTLARRILAGPLFVLLGKSSYSFYLLHAGVLAACLSSLNSSPLVLFILVNIASVLMFKCYEEPLNRWLKAIVRPGKAGKPLAQYPSLKVGLPTGTFLAAGGSFGTPGLPTDRQGAFSCHYASSVS